MENLYDSAGLSFASVTQPEFIPYHLKHFFADYISRVMESLSLLLPLRQHSVWRTMAAGMTLCSKYNIKLYVNNHVFIHFFE